MLMRLEYSKPVYIKEMMNYFVVGGSRGVFDIDDLVTVLRSENAKDICVIALPEHLRLADYMVIVSGISFRHCRAITSTIQWIVSSLLQYGSPSSCIATPVKDHASYQTRFEMYRYKDSKIPLHSTPATEATPTKGHPFYQAPFQ